MIFGYNVEDFSINSIVGQNVKVQALKSIRDFYKHRSSTRLHFGDKWFMHFGCVNGFLGLYHGYF
jgi:hypothetical protein